MLRTLRPILLGKDRGFFCLESDRGTHSRQILDLLAHLVGAKLKNYLNNLKTAVEKKHASPEAAMNGGKILPT